MYTSQSSQYDIESELKRLFALQDKPCSKDKLDILVRELMGNDLPNEAILLAIKKLQKEDINSIKLATILRSTSSYVLRDDNPIDCPDCRDGFIIFRDQEGRSFSLGCQCDQGMARCKNLGLARWRGGTSYLNKGRVMVKAPFFNLKPNSPETPEVPF